MKGIGEAMTVETKTPKFARHPGVEMTAHLERGVREQAPTSSRRRPTARFLLHYFEMCAPMCIGFAVGDVVYFWAAAQQGYDDPFRQLPALSVLVVTFTMTAPMTAWMRFRGMPSRAIAEMSAVMPVLAVVLLALGWLAIVPMGDLALLEHGLMMPAMLVPMVLRLDLYTGRGEHGAHSH